ncbi:hypothetical protein QQS21_004642 [Conoideocrella luteorostrata]|uniref:Uncharacterized protein n=1 Tax=Conoideocrella luteorostrata TaxID=1105319 RepID=A0AAJ0CQV3_9HYPO|nr:hypothetical protein QQS21_004642 [Conoideocrella luteorostrata]
MGLFVSSTRITVSPTTMDQNGTGASGGPGRGAIAGIVVGVIAGLAVIIGITYILTRHILLRKRANDTGEPGKQFPATGFESNTVHELAMHHHTSHAISELGTDTITRQPI